MADYGCCIWDETGAGISPSLYFPKYPELEALEKEIDDWETWYWKTRDDEEHFPYGEFDKKGLELTHKLSAILKNESVKIIYKECWRPDGKEMNEVVVKDTQPKEQPPKTIRIMADYCWAYDEEGLGTNIAIYFPQYPELKILETEFDDWSIKYCNICDGKSNGTYDEIDQKGIELTHKLATIMKDEQVKVIYRKCWRPGKIEDVDIVIKE